MNISISTKKVAVVAAGLVLALSAVFVTTAKAATAAELQAQIQALLAQIAGLQAQVGGTTTTGTCTASQFTLNHKMNDKGGEVMAIQKFLNANGFTVAASGAGSKGMETSYFGPATKAAVMKFQTQYSAEILVPTGLSSATGFWGAASRAKANAMEQAACAGNNTSTTTPTGTATVSAAAQPGNSLAPMAAQNIPFTKFTVTAGSKDVEIENVVVELTGLAQRDAFSSVQLLGPDGLLIGDEEKIDSDDQAEIGDNYTIKAGKSVTFTVAATRVDTDENMAGDVASFSVVAVNSSATLAGALPITGAQHTINESLSIADLTIGNVSSVGGTVDMGEEDVDVATLNFGADGEDVLLKKVRLYQDGNADIEEALDDVVATFDGEEYTVTVDGDYLTVDFGNGALIEDGDSMDLEITARIVAGASDTVTFIVKDASDILAVGKKYGYGLAGETATGETFEIGAGDVVIKKDSDFEEDTVAAGTTGVAMAGFATEILGEDVTGDITVTVSVSATTSDENDTEIKNFAIYKNGARVSDRETVTFDSSTTKSVEFSNITLAADNEDDVVYEIRGDISQDAPDNTLYTVKTIAMANIENESGDDVDAVSSVSLNYDTDVEGANVALTLSSPSPAEVNSDMDGEIVAELTIDADDSGDDIKVTKIALGGSTTAASTTAEVTNCRLYDGSSSVSKAYDMSAGVTTFSGLAITVKAGESKDLTVKCDLSADVIDGNTIKFTTIGFDAKGITTGTEFTVANTTGDEGTGNSTVTVKDGTLTATKTADDENDDKAVMEGSTAVVLGIVEVKANDANVVLDDVVASVATSSAINGKIKLYVDGSLKTSETAATTTPFTNLNIKVDKGQKVAIKFVADIKSSATTTGTKISGVTFTPEVGTAATVSALSAVTISTALPVVASVDVDSTSLATADDVKLFGFSVTANGDDVVVNTAKASATLSQVNLSNAYWYVYDNKAGSGTEEAKVPFTSGSAATLNVTVPEGDTYYVYVVGDTDLTGDRGSVRVQMTDALGAMTFTPAVFADLVLTGDIKSLLSY